MSNWLVNPTQKSITGLASLLRVQKSLVIFKRVHIQQQARIVPGHVDDAVARKDQSAAGVAAERHQIGKGAAVEQDGVGALLTNERRDDGRSSLGVLFQQRAHQRCRDERLVSQGRFEPRI